MDFFSADLQTSLLIILNLVVIESLLSVDNAAVLATMVMDLPENQRSRALKYGIFGAYFFRGICLIFAAWLVKLWWLKPLGGAYLLILCIKYFLSKSTPQTDDDVLDKSSSKAYQFVLRLMGGQFWATVIFVELMDLAFSLDNVLAAVAFTNDIRLIIIGVFIGILSMRFVAQFFVVLLEKFPFLESVAFIVIGILGLKLIVSIDLFADNSLIAFLNSHYGDVLVSFITVLVFVLPIVSSLLINFPENKRKLSS